MPIAPDPFRMPVVEIMIEASGTFSVAIESAIEASSTFLPAIESAIEATSTFSPVVESAIEESPGFLHFGVSDVGMGAAGAVVGA